MDYADYHIVLVPYDFDKFKVTNIKMIDDMEVNEYESSRVKNTDNVSFERTQYTRIEMGRIRELRANRRSSNGVTRISGEQSESTAERDNEQDRRTDGIKHSLDVDYYKAKNSDTTQAYKLLKENFDIVNKYRFTAQDINRIATDLKNKYNSTANTQNLRVELTNLFKLVNEKNNNLENSDVQSYAQSIVKTLMENGQKVRTDSS